ncbi:hypothetical protein EDM59_01510 [Brevibacillus nitrificans]|uniref:Uncharacterized protein n=1 Tax=Brevibacillus nitrificans TaxID=651560 RepID=A0A3M8DRR6_9BACL|nr:hypothetical protein [Brevibacillus nitrificans]RNB90151.1 hypothetical protein EDM59_01510 [Brevibacillus nitrificans]
MGFNRFSGFSSFASSMNIENLKQTLPLLPGEAVKLGDVCEVTKGYVRKTKREAILQGAISDVITKEPSYAIKAYKIDETFTLLAYVMPPSSIEVLLVEHNADGSIKTPTNTALSFVSAYGYTHDLFIDKLPNGKFVIFTNGLLSAYVVNVDMATKVISLVASRAIETGTNYGKDNFWVEKVSVSPDIVKYMIFYNRGAGNAGVLYTVVSFNLTTNAIDVPTTPIAGIDANVKTGVAGIRLSKNRYLLVTNESLITTWNVFDYNPATDKITVVKSRQQLGSSNSSGYTQREVLLLPYAKNKFLILKSIYHQAYGNYYAYYMYVTYDEITGTLTLDAGSRATYPLPYGVNDGDSNFMSVHRLAKISYNTFLLVGAEVPTTGSIRGTRAAFFQLNRRSDGTPEVKLIKQFDYTINNATEVRPDIVPFGIDKFHLFFCHNITGGENIKMVDISARGSMPVGLATHDASSGSVTIQLKGVLKGLNLACGQTYYCNEFGDLSYTDGAVLVGTSISADTLLIPGIINNEVIPQDY